ncbi:MAG: sortase [Bifidobacterium crudilactis]|nr:sortase [Bifidobacterium crudilactis]
MTHETVVRGGDDSSWRSLLRPVPSRRLSRLTRSVRRLRRGSVVSLVVALVCVGMPLWLYVASAPVSRSIRDAIAGDPQALRMVERADEYNERLLAQGVADYGNVPAETGGGLKSDEDEAYMSALAGPDTVMGAIRIPRLSIDLDIRHGTGDRALNQGAGHYYGTMLPTGSEGVSVIAAHRGLGSRLLFLRLGELNVGDLVYTSAFTRSLAWKVTRIERIVPGGEVEREVLLSRKGETLLRLYTCDPVGLSTRRLIVTAVPTVMPDSARSVDGVDPVMAVLCGVAALAVSVLVCNLMFKRVSVGKHISHTK